MSAKHDDEKPVSSRTKIMSINQVSLMQVVRNLTEKSKLLNHTEL